MIIMVVLLLFKRMSILHSDSAVKVMPLSAVPIHQSNAFGNVGAATLMFTGAGRCRCTHTNGHQVALS